MVRHQESYLLNKTKREHSRRRGGKKKKASRVEGRSERKKKRGKERPKVPHHREGENCWGSPGKDYPEKQSKKETEKVERNGSEI